MDNFGDNFSENARLFQLFKASEEDERLLKKLSIIESVIGKFKNFFGVTLSVFRSP
ncbi:MAG: hypothetical protein LBQ23_02580 [Puniceicoccales bacterium]|nr:hypothetical protein [Puniceicoccales bacterium]